MWILLVLIPAVGLALLVGALLLNRVPLNEAPGLGARLLSYLTTNIAETRPDHRFPELRPRHFPMPASELYQHLNGAMRALGWREIRADPSRLRMEAVITSRLFGFRDDLLAEVHPAGEESCTLYLRSASRVGRGDMGANTRHLLDLYLVLAPLEKKRGE